MPESLLSLQLADIARAVGHRHGFGREASKWDGWDTANPYVPKDTGNGAANTQLSWIMECVQAGYRRFLYPKLVDEGPVAYEWGFLTPQRQITIVAATTRYDLPDDFQDLVGELTFQPADNSWQTIHETGIGEVKRRLAQANGLTTFPEVCAIVPKASDGSQGQRMEIVFAPIPDRTYTLDGRWSVLPGPLTAVAPFPYGGMEHGETIVASCIAVVEQRFNNIANGPDKQDFEERLKASIAIDRETKPENFGYNGDRSDRRDLAWPYFPTYGTDATAVLHNGVPW